MNDTPTAAPIHEDFLTQLRRVAADRMETWCSDTDLPCGLFHATELGGEVGEVLNVVKKLHREAQGGRGSRATVGDLAQEIGDVVVCLDKLAAYYGIDLAQAAAAKFNATSEKVGLPHRLGEAVAPTPVFTFSADAEDNASETQKGGQSVCSGAQDGYASAFYEIATMLGIGAQAASPADVWRDQMRPKLEALTQVTETMSYRTSLIGRETAGADQAEAALAARTAGFDPSDANRPSDEQLEAYLPKSLRAEKRCGIQRSAWMTSWYVPWSPRNDNENAEGPWSHWVALAHEILKVDTAAIAAASAKGGDHV